MSMGKIRLCPFSLGSLISKKLSVIISEVLNISIKNASLI